MAGDDERTGHDMASQERPTEDREIDRQFVSNKVKLAVFTGIFLLRIVSSVPWIWGNLAAYVTSYYYARGDTTSGSLTGWIISVEVITFNIAMTIGKPVATRIGQRTLLLIGLFLFNGGIFLTYLSVKHSVMSLCVTFAGMTGFAGGITEAVQLILIVRWTEQYYGLTTSSVQSSVVLGGVILNFLLTAYINPHNLDADLTIDRKAVFSQPDVVDRVPSVFLLYGALSTMLNLLGFLLVRDNPGDKDICTETTRRLFGTKQSIDDRVTLVTSEDYVVVTSLEESSPPSRNSSPGLQYHSNNSFDDNNETLTSQNLEINDATTNNGYSMNRATPENSDETSINSSNSDSDLTPREVLKEPSFYALMFFKVVQMYGFLILNTYYKTFGLLFIHDDHFLTAIAMVKCFVTPVCTWIAGSALDKFGVKTTVTVISGIFCVVTSFFYLTPIAKWLYFFSCLLYGCALFTLFCVTGACCVKLYGETHFTTIYGMLFIPCYIIVPILPPLTEWIISTIGWFALFISVGFLALFNVFGLLWGLPRERTCC